MGLTKSPPPRQVYLPQWSVRRVLGEDCSILLPFPTEAVGYQRLREQVSVGDNMAIGLMLVT